MEEKELTGWDDKSSKRKIKVGDRVKTTHGVGTVIEVKDNMFGSDVTWYAVVHDENVNGHSLEGRCETGKGWWTYDENTTLLES